MTVIAAGEFAAPLAFPAGRPARACAMLALLVAIVMKEGRQVLEKLVIWLLKLFVAPLPDAEEISLADVQRGDVVLKRTEDNWKSVLIMALDQGSYSHAGFFDGEQVVDCGEHGIVRRELFHCDVYRFHDEQGHELDPEDQPPLPAAPVADTIERYYECENEYGYLTLVLVGILMVVRLVTRPALRVLVELAGAILLNQVRKAIDWLRDNDKVSFTCAELVVHGYWDPSKPEGDPYGLRIELDERHKPLWTALGADGGLRARMAAELERLRPGFRAELAALREGGADRVGAEVIAGSAALPAGFVSPGDLQRAKNLRLVGRYRGRPGQASSIA